MRQTTMAGAIAVAAALLTQGAAAQATPQYKAVPLQVDGSFTQGCLVTAINSVGVAGGMCFDAVREVPSMWDAQGRQTLLAVPADAQFANVTGINDSNELSGIYENAALAVHALRWDPAGHVSAMPGDAMSWAYGINDNGDIAGSQATGNTHALVCRRDGSVIALQEPAGRVYSSSAYAINASGTLAGNSIIESPDGSGYNAPVLYGRRTWVLPTPQLVGFNVALALNSQGIAVGYGQTTQADPQIAWQWTPSQATPLPGLPGSTIDAAQGINDLGVVVGTSMDATGYQRGVKWVRGKVVKLDDVTLLPASLTGGRINQANAINANGWIAAVVGLEAPDQSRPVILKPLRALQD